MYKNLYTTGKQLKHLLLEWPDHTFDVFPSVSVLTCKGSNYKKLN